jgi:hypothetical protein
MAKRSVAAKIWLGLGACLVLFAGLLWLSHRRAAKSLQAWKASMAAEGERFGIDELAPPPALYDANAGELIAAVNRLRGHAFDPGSGNHPQEQPARPGEARRDEPRWHYYEVNPVRTNDK